MRRKQDAEALALRLDQALKSLSSVYSDFFIRLMNPREAARYTLSKMQTTVFIAAKLKQAQFCNVTL